MDIATLLQRAAAGTIDAQENPLTNTFNFGIHKLQPYITLSGHFWTPATLLANQETYRSWPEKIKEAVHAAGAASTAFQRDLAVTEDQKILAGLDDTVDVTRLTPESKAAFVEATSPVIDATRDTFGDALEIIKGS